MQCKLVTKNTVEKSVLNIIAKNLFHRQCQKKTRPDHEKGFKLMSTHTTPPFPVLTRNVGAWYSSTFSPPTFQNRPKLSAFSGSF